MQRMRPARLCSALMASALCVAQGAVSDAYAQAANPLITFDHYHSLEEIGTYSGP